MAYYSRAGIMPRKHFMRFTNSAGQFIHEELLSTQGFQGPSSLLYRLNPPTRVLRVESPRIAEVKPWTAECRNHLFEVDRVVSFGDPLSSRRALVFNEDLILWVAKPTAGTHGYYRNGYCDELTLIVEGRGTLRSAFGDLDYGPLDYVYVPRGATVQWLPEAGTQTWVVVESNDPISIPARFRNSAGQLLSRAPYHERDIRLPVLQDPCGDTGEFEILVKMADQVVPNIVDSNPFDVVGWDGSLYPYAFSMHDYEPISGTFGQAPDMYQVFETEGAAICNFTPRQADGHPERSPAQVIHMNLDYDEVLYRIHAEAAPNPVVKVADKPSWSPEPSWGTITLNRRSVPHGPKAGYENRPLMARMSAFMFMVDTKRPLTVSADAMGADAPEYIRSGL